MEEQEDLVVDIPQEHLIEQRLVAFHDDEIVAAKHAIMVDAIVIQGNLTYVQIYGPLKHRFRVAKYSEIADEQYEAVVALLTELSQKLISPDVPTQRNLF